MNGIDCFFEGFRLVRQPGLRRYVVIPLLINIVVLSAIMFYGMGQYEILLATISGWLPDWLSFLAGIISFLTAVIVFAIGIYLFTIIANIIASPFNSLLSEKVEELLVPGLVRESPGILTILGRSVAREVSKLLYLLPRLLGLLLFSVIPGVNAFAPLVWILFGAWMMAVQYADYGADNNQLSLPKLRDRLSQSKLQALLFGLIVYFLLAIPIVNLFLIPIAVAGGTVLWVKHLSTGVNL
ncbi:MAG: CysZ protein [Planctomycetaceae bacterium]|jgi:CysZ protein